MDSNITIILTDVSIKVKIVLELRDSIEIVQSSEYARFLALLMPAFTYILSNVAPIFVSVAPAQVRAF
jgi:transformation/transcription domain-associated protein